MEKIAVENTNTRDFLFIKKEKLPIAEKIGYKEVKDKEKIKLKLKEFKNDTL